MRIDFVRLKTPVCFLVMTLVALAVIVIMSKGEVDVTDSDSTNNVQFVNEGEEMNVAIEESLFF